MTNLSTENFTIRNKNEHYLLNHKRHARARPVYKIKYYSGEPVEGIYYRKELQLIRNNEFKIERVLKRRISANKNEEQIRQVARLA